jgi:hypothetical protein
MKIVQPLQAVHSDEQRKNLALAFNRTCGNGIPYLAPQDYDKILAEIPDIANKINNKENINIEWDLNLIESMLEKGYNPVALHPTLVSVNWCINSLKSLATEQQQIHIVELGTGAGWSTLILYNFLQHEFDDFVLHAIDESPYAIGCTAKMLEHFGITYQIIENGKTTTDTPVENAKIILYVNDFVSGTSLFEQESVQAVYSNHGTTYLEFDEHSKMLKNIQTILISKGVFISDSLDPQTSINLDRLFVVGSVFRGKNKERFSKIPSEKHFLYANNKDEVKIITAMRDESAANFLDWLSYLFYSGKISVFMKYLSALRKSVKSQQVIREWVKVSSKDLYVHINSSKASNWLSECVPPNTQVPYVQTVKLIKRI